MKEIAAITNQETLPAGTKLYSGDSVYVVENIIAHGGTSVVYQVSSGHQTYALKEYTLSGEYKSSGAADYFEKESLIASTLAKSNILIQEVRLLRNVYLEFPNINAQQKASKTYAFLRNLSEIGPSLESILKEKFTLSQALWIIRQIAYVLKGIHKTKSGESFLHGDIKPGNIFLLSDKISHSESVGVILIDFGSAQKINIDEFSLPISKKELFWTPIYSAPEIQQFGHGFRSHIRLSLSSDIYSAMVIFSSLLFGQPTMRESEQLSDIIHDRLSDLVQRESLDIATETLLKKLFRDGLATLPQERIPNAESLNIRLDELNYCINGGGINKYFLWRKAIFYMEKRKEYFRTDHPLNYSDINCKTPNKITLDIPVYHNNEKIHLTDDWISSHSQKRVFFLQGGMGSGKTFLLSGLMKKMLHKGRQIPFYIDFAELGKDAIFYKSKKEDLLNLSRLVFDKYLPDTSLRFIRQLENYFKKSDGKPEYLLILENVHKNTQQSEIILDEIASLICSFPNIQLFISAGTSTEEREILLEIIPDQNMIYSISLPGFTKEEILSYTEYYLPEKTEKTSYTRQNILNLESLLSVPFFLTRYISGIHAETQKDDAVFLSVTRGGLLYRYFNSLRPSAYIENPYFFSKVITVFLPEIAHYMEIENLTQISKSEIQILLQLNHESMLQFQNLVMKSDIFRIGYEDKNVFAQECYREYFSAYYIVTTLQSAVAEGQIQDLQEINYLWPRNTIEICAQLQEYPLLGEISSNQCASVFHISHIYDLFLSKADNYDKRFFDLLPYNLFCLTGDSLWISMSVRYADTYFHKHMINGMFFWNEKVIFYNEVKKHEKFGTDKSNKNRMPIHSIENVLEEIEDKNLLFQLGREFYHGGRIMQNIDRSFFLIEKAAQKNHAAAQLWLSEFYREGIATSPNLEKSQHWLLRSAKAGNITAMELLGNLYMEEYEDAQKIKEGLSLYISAARKGHGNAQMNLACYYYDTKNYKMAQKWLKIVSYSAPAYRNNASKLLSLLAKQRIDSLSDEDQMFRIDMGKLYGKISRSLQIPAIHNLMSLGFFFYSAKNEIRTRFMGFLK